MTRTLIIKRSDGGVSVGGVAERADPAIVVRKWEEAGDRRALWWRVIDGEVSLRDEYRDAWLDHDGSAPTHDMPKAREVHREHIRARRAPLLAEQDLALMLVDEDETLTAAVRLQRRRAVIAKKKLLRDAPADPRIEAAQTIDELRAVDPLTEAT
jgi:hypothetical protein